MKHVGAASRCFELDAIHFIDCHFSYSDVKDGADTEVKIGVVDQDVSRDGSILRVSMLFEFVAPSPFPDEAQSKRVEIRARLSLDYVHQSDRGEVDDADADMFGRVNGIYNAWPYLREYVQSSLIRLGLPSFELPLLRAGAAAQLAGLVDPVDEPETESAKP